MLRLFTTLALLLVTTANPAWASRFEICDRIVHYLVPHPRSTPENIYDFISIEQYTRPIDIREWTRLMNSRHSWTPVASLTTIFHSLRSAKRDGQRYFEDLHDRSTIALYLEVNKELDRLAASIIRRAKRDLKGDVLKKFDVADIVGAIQDLDPNIFKYQGNPDQLVRADQLLFYEYQEHWSHWQKRLKILKAHLQPTRQGRSRISRMLSPID